MEKEIDITVKLEQAQAMNEIYRDSLKEKSETIRHMKHIIIALIISFFATVCAGYGAFVWYESQFATLENPDDITTTEVQLDTSGDNAVAEYNDVEGDQYNDNATHSEGGN